MIATDLHFISNILSGCTTHTVQYKCSVIIECDEVYLRLVFGVGRAIDLLRIKEMPI